jgi:hypothetical protein
VFVGVTLPSVSLALLPVGSLLPLIGPLPVAAARAVNSLEVAAGRR